MVVETMRGSPLPGLRSSQSRRCWWWECGNDESESPSWTASFRLLAGWEFGKKRGDVQIRVQQLLFLFFPSYCKAQSFVARGQPCLIFSNRRDNEEEGVSLCRRGLIRNGNVCKDLKSRRDQVCLAHCPEQHRIDPLLL